MSDQKGNLVILEAVKRPITSTVFTRKERGLLVKLANLYSVMHENRSEAMAVGGIALRFYVDPKFTSKFIEDGYSGSLSDVDLAFMQMPGWLNGLITKEPLQAKTVIKLSGDSPSSKVDKRYKVYGDVGHLREELEKEMPLFYDVCFFEGRVGRIGLVSEDFEKARQFLIQVPDAADYTLVKIMDPGLLIATILTPQAISDLRARRISLLLASQTDDLQKITDRYIEVVEREGIPKDELHTPIGRLRNILCEKTGEAVRYFINEVEKRVK